MFQGKFDAARTDERRVQLQQWLNDAVRACACAAVAGTDGVIKAHITCHKCGRKGHFADKCTDT